jgi:predicted amidohydrolase YtcJ
VIRRLSAAAILLLASAAACSAPDSLVLHNATVYTANDARPRAEAVVAKNGQIVFVGTSVEALNVAPPGARRIDLKKQTLLPGLTDSHAHLLGIGLRELEFNLEGTGSLKELQDRLRQRTPTTKPGEWLTGRGWIETHWSPAAFPTRQDLDAITRDRAVVLIRADGHALIANSLALKRAGIDRTTKDPAGGAILKDPNGEPTGMLIDEAMELVRSLIPPRTTEESLKALEVGAAKYTQLGWTQVQNAGTSWAEVELMCRLYREGRIQLRIYDAIGGPGADADRLLKEGPSINRCGDKLTVRTIKLYMDGALGSRGAALLEPYKDRPESNGLILNTPEVLYPILAHALNRGIQVETHAIGDRGNRMILGLYEKAFKEAGKQRSEGARWRIEHAQVINAADIPRFAKLGVIASMQPSHAIGDLYFAGDRLGPDRLAGAYAWKSLLDSGAVIAAGSDAPVEKGDPRIELYAAVARRSLDGHTGAGWHPEQRVTRDQALKMLTLAPAFAAFQEKERGSIEVGKQADFTVFSADVMTIPEPEILKAQIVMTIIQGDVVYESVATLAKR